MILKLWNSLSAKPLGKTLFNNFIRFYVPYTASVHPQVMELRPGYARVQIKDRRSVRNHLNSIHAVAMMNLGEAATGMALMAGLPEWARAILVKFQIEYLKKGRGTLTAIGDIKIPELEPGAPRQEFQIHANILNAEQEIVAKVYATWLIDGGKTK